MKQSLLRFAFTILIIWQCSKLFAQEYWQQQVDYKIEVTLDDTLQRLNGFITVKYKNNSPEQLNFIYFHLWPNAYKDQSTPLAKQLVENGKTKFWYSNKSKRGFIGNINFKVNAEASRWEMEPGSGEICKVYLNAPLKTGESVSISTPFTVQLPETFSRLGHIGQSYQITQWYPKPAVYDKYGWHPMPYLDQGEFYSEFGSFDVSITLPKNYVVGATGDLQDEEEIKWLNDKAKQTENNSNWVNESNMAFPPSAKESKTLHYKQTNIHDFGWFADKRYHVLKGEVVLPHSQRKVTTWALCTNNQPNLWSKAPEYLHDAIQYYSEWIGDYPYNQITAVDGTISAGSGMEYPNITVIGEEKSAFSLDEVMTHEIGHNWFYGILGSNERDHAWMDEGINSYYEYRYTRTKYPNRRLLGDQPDVLAKFLGIEQFRHKYQMDFAYQFVARENIDEPIEQTSSKFTDINYGVSVYGKSMLILDYLEAYLGTELFDKAMKKYFETWKYKHPQPEDFRKVIETETGKNLSWFFDDLLATTKKMDYRLKSVDGYKSNADSLTVTIANNNKVVAPVTVSLIKRDSIIYSKWFEGFTGTQKLRLPKLDADKVQIDPLLKMPEVYRRNNTFKLNKLAHKFEKLRFQFIASIENPNRTQVCFVPYIGGNNYDKTEVGLAFYNPFLPRRHFFYMFVPAIGTGSKQFIGFLKLGYNFFPETMQRLTIGVNTKRFSYMVSSKALMYNKIEPYINLVFQKNRSRSPFSQNLNIRSVNIWENINHNDYYFDGSNKIFTQYYFINEMKYALERNSTLHPFDVNLTMQQGKDFIGLWAEGHFKVSYKPKNQGLFIRVFAGGFPVYVRNSSNLSAPLPNLYLSSATTSNYAYWLQKDYTYDENYVDRNGRNNTLARQVAFTGGGFRSLTNFGRTSKFLMATNITSSIYRFVPFRPFVSMGAVLDDFKKMNFAAEFGLSAVIVPDMIEIHLPFVTTKNIADEQKANGIDKWYKKFTFTFKIKLQQPVNLLKQLAGV